MKNETMFSNVNQKFAETVANRQSKTKSVNQQLLQMIGRVRSLQDQLIAEQYRYELLMQQNQTYKQALNNLDSNNQLQEMRLKKLDEQMELHKIKNKELYNCEQSLKLLQQQINELTIIAQRKADECESMQLQQTKISKQNQTVKQMNRELFQKQSLVNAIIEDYLKQNQQSMDSQAQPVDYLRLRLQTLRQSLAQIEDQQNRVRKQNLQLINIEKQKTIKLQYQQQLLKQRASDGEKITQIAKICKSQQNLQAVVQQMLTKQDQLVYQLKRAKEQYQYIDTKIQGDLQQIEYSWDEEKQGYQRQLRELIKKRQNICFQTEYVQSQLSQRRQNLMRKNQNYELMFRINEELNQMQRLRVAQQKNNNLKRKIKYFTQVRRMMRQEKDIVEGSRAIY